MILLLAAGHGPTAVAQRLGTSDRLVRKWRARWENAPGLDALRDAERTGAPPTFSIVDRCGRGLGAGTPINDGELWVPSSRRRVVDELVETIDGRGHVLLTGEPGVGKTCVLRALRRRVPESGFRLTYCHNATLGRRDFYRHVCLALGLSPKATAAAVFWTIAEHVRELDHARVHSVFLLDEAHLLHQDVLEHLHILTNYEWDSRALLSIVLV